MKQFFVIKSLQKLPKSRNCYDQYKGCLDIFFFLMDEQNVCIVESILPQGSLCDIDIVYSKKYEQMPEHVLVM